MVQGGPQPRPAGRCGILSACLLVVVTEHGSGLFCYIHALGTGLVMACSITSVLFLTMVHTLYYICLFALLL